MSSETSGVVCPHLWTNYPRGRFFPRELLEDESAVEQKKQELTSELETYKNYHQELKDLTEKILRKGGVQIVWRMN